MSVPNNNFTMFAGETPSIACTITNALTGALVDFTGATITWIVKSGQTTVLTKTVGSGISVSGAGAFTITLASANTSSLSGDYQHECRTTLADGNVFTLFTGSMIVKPTLTA